MLAGPGRDPEEAATAWEKALDIDPARVIAMERLEAVLTDLDDPARLARAITRHLEAVPNSVGRRMQPGPAAARPAGVTGARRR